MILCDRRCERGLGDLQPAPVWVGVDPPVPVVRDWPFTDPAVRWLADDAPLSGPGPAYVQVTVAELRSGAARPTTTAVAPPPPTTAPPAPAAEVAAPAPHGPSDDGGGAVPWLAGAGVVAAVVAAPWWLLTRRRAHRAVRL